MNQLDITATHNNNIFEITGLPEKVVYYKDLQGLHIINGTGDLVEYTVRDNLLMYSNSSNGDFMEDREDDLLAIENVLESV